MAVITPVGKSDFDWSPKDSAEMVKTASTGSKETDKDALYAAAKKVMAEFGASKEEASKGEASADVSKSEVSKGETSSGASGDTSADASGASADASKAPFDGSSSKGETSSGASLDLGASKEVGVSKAVEVLLEKVEKSKDIVEKVDAAMGKVEQAVEEVKSAVGETSGASDLPVTPEAGPAPEIPVDGVPEEAEFEIEVEGVPEVGESCDKPEIGGEDIVQTSLGAECGACAASIKGDMKKEAAADDMVKTSKLSPSTRTKLMAFWKEKLKYDAEYCKIWFADNK